MRRIFLAGSIGIGLLMFSCSKKEMPVDNGTSSGATAVEHTSAGNLSGEQMIETLDCSGCHSVTEKMVGPSYQEIAAKYTDKDTEMLASKIIEGGSGVWGSVPMAAHPQVSKEDARKIVQYIISLKK